MIRPVLHIGALTPYALADPGGKDTVSLAQNESAFPASPAALVAGRESLADLPLYPDPDWTDLREAIAEVHGVDPQRILCGAGSMELIGCLMRAYAGAGDVVLGTEFSYAYVASASAQVQADFVRAQEMDFTVSVDEILASVCDRTRIVFVCNPGNPSGTGIANSEIVRLRNSLPDDILLAVDQAYGEFADDDPDALFPLVERGTTVVLRTFSKAYSLAGARVGWGLFPGPIAGELRKVLNPNNVSVFAQAAAAAAMRDQAHMKMVVSETARIRDRFCSDLKAMGLRVPRSQTNFVLIRFASTKAAEQAHAKLVDNGLLLRPMTAFGLSDCLRATICPEPVMARVLKVLEETL
ncbi:MAG: histidinol-phosphate transaminase [Pseudomonadota bacterium]